MKTDLQEFRSAKHVPPSPDSHSILSNREEEFDGLVQLAAIGAKAPTALIWLVDNGEPYIKAAFGWDIVATGKYHRFFGQLIAANEIIEIENTSLDNRFVPAALEYAETNCMFYAGYPLVSNGETIGTLCVLDVVTRRLTTEQDLILQLLSRQIVQLLDLQRRHIEAGMQVKTLELKQERLQELSLSQSQIISYIAHDVRNPLSSLKGIIDMNSMLLLTPNELEEAMRMLTKQLDGTLDLLTNLIEWGQAQIHRKVPHIRGVNFFEVVRKSVNNLEIAANLKRNKLVNDVTQGQMLIADEYMLRFIIRNLLSNANKFTSNGTICISAKNVEGKMLISVQDTGTGIAEKIRNKLFNNNERSTSPGTNNEQGSGLGLALAKEFVEKLGSTLSLTTAEGKGTTFSFHLLPG